MPEEKKYECPICGGCNTDDMGRVVVLGEDGGTVNLVYCHECDIEFEIGLAETVSGIVGEDGENGR